MEQKHVGISLIIAAVLVMVFAQLLFKSRLNFHGAIPFKPVDFFPYLWQLIQDWKVWAGGFGLIVSALLWYAAVSRVPLSFAFPVAAMSYPMIMITSIIFLGEDFTFSKLGANVLIVTGVLIIGFSDAT